MLKLHFSIVISVITLNFFLNFLIEEKEKKNEKLKIKYEKIEKKLDLIKINYSFLIRPENLKIINKNNFELEPYGLEDIKLIITNKEYKKKWALIKS